MLHEGRDAGGDWCISAGRWTGPGYQGQGTRRPGNRGDGISRTLEDQAEQEQIMSAGRAVALVLVFAMLGLVEIWALTKARAEEARVDRRWAV